MTSTGKDCHFFYYKECVKGNNCEFRHCLEAKLTDEVCDDWQVGKCEIDNCPRRHHEEN
eukprot:Awhi_evm1s9186